MDDKPLYRTTDFFSYFFPTLLLIGTVVGYFLGLHLFVVGFLGLATIVKLFNDRLSVIVYADRVNFCYSNITGRLTAIDNIFYFKDITSFSFESSQWKASAGQGVLIILVGLFLPGNRLSFKGKPQTIVKISTKNLLGDTKDTELILETNSADVLKALSMTQAKCK